MEHPVETEKRELRNDRKMARIITISACVVLFIVLSFIGYRISNPILKQEFAQKDVALIPLDAHILEQGIAHGGAGSLSKVTKAETTPPQMQQVLTTENSHAHEKSGNSSNMNSTTPTDHPAMAKHVSENPFGTGGVNGEKYGGSSGNHPWSDNQTEQNKSLETGKRYLVEKPNTATIRSDENCKIVLSVLIDPNGTIIGNPGFVKNASTTNDITLTNQVIKIVKDQARFNKVTATNNVKETIVIRITAH